MAFTIYASLIPFEFRWVPVDRATQRFHQVMLGERAERTSRSNYLANLLLFVPIGFGLAGAVFLDRRLTPDVLARGAAILPASLAVSLTAEFLQIYTRERIVSRYDVIRRRWGAWPAWGAGRSPATVSRHGCARPRIAAAAIASHAHSARTPSRGSS